MFFFVNACYGGLAAVTPRSALETRQLTLGINSTVRARQIITAGEKGEEVYEDALWGHSAFTQKLLEGLGRGDADQNKDSLITASELYSYLRSQVPTATGGRQKPVSRQFT